VAIHSSDKDSFAAPFSRACATRFDGLHPFYCVCRHGLKQTQIHNVLNVMSRFVKQNGESLKLMEIHIGVTLLDFPSAV